MGCVYSSSELHFARPGLYKVYNVDDQGEELSEGYMDITESNLALYQVGREPIRWPLRCIRRYGGEGDLFSFESGRRCPTGPGIYAFKCRRTQALFANLQEAILRTGQENTSRYNRSNTLNSPHDASTHVLWPTSYTSPPCANAYRQNAPPSYTPLAMCRSRLSPKHNYVNGQVTNGQLMNGGRLAGIQSVSTMRFQNSNIVEIPDHHHHDYLNTANGHPAEQYVNVPLEGDNYCNVGHSAAPLYPNSHYVHEEAQQQQYLTPVDYELLPVNYIQLDLDRDGDSLPNTPTSPSMTDRMVEQYAEIDFAATKALSKSVNEDIRRRPRMGSNIS